jgi:hypothetical protein
VSPRIESLAFAPLLPRGRVESRVDFARHPTADLRPCHAVSYTPANVRITSHRWLGLAQVAPMVVRITLSESKLLSQVQILLPVSWKIHARFIPCSTRFPLRRGHGARPNF